VAGTMSMSFVAAVDSGPRLALTSTKPGLPSAGVPVGLGDTAIAGAEAGSAEGMGPGEGGRGAGSVGGGGAVPSS